MRLIKGLALALVMALPLASAQAEESPQTVDELVVNVQKTYQEINSLQADFLQVTRSATMGEQRQRGKVTLSRPKKMRWDSVAQGGALFMTDGQRMVIYTPSEKQALIYEDLSNAGGSGMFDLLNGFDNLSEFFEVALVEGETPKEKKGVTAVLTPKQDSQFKQIKLVFNHKNYEIMQIVTVDAFGVETDISFTQVKLNQKVEDSVFEFETPRGVEVIKADGI